MSTYKPRNDCCKSCGKKWYDHHGIEVTCEQLQLTRAALELANDALKLIALYSNEKKCIAHCKRTLKKADL